MKVYSDPSQFGRLPEKYAQKTLLCHIMEKRIIALLLYIIGHLMLRLVSYLGNGFVRYCHEK